MCNQTKPKSTHLAPPALSTSALKCSRVNSPAVSTNSSTERLVMMSLSSALSVDILAFFITDTLGPTQVQNTNLDRFDISSPVCTRNFDLQIVLQKVGIKKIQGHISKPKVRSISGHIEQSLGPIARPINP